MRAVCVTEKRELEVREIPSPADPTNDENLTDHVLLEMEACAINHGDKAFLARPRIAAGLNTSTHDIWGASGAGRVVAAGSKVPATYVGRKVAVYRSLTPSPHTMGLWSARALVPYTSCVILPEHLATLDYSGSLVNVMTAYAYLEEIAAEGHQGVIVTAGNSATGLAMAAFAQERNFPALFLVRSAQAREAMQAQNVKHVLATSDEDFDTRFKKLAEELNATAVFDGVGGELTSRIAPISPVNTAVSIYGFLGGVASITIPTAVFMTQNLTLRRFSNFASVTVRDTNRLRAGLTYLQGQIDNSLFKTRVGKAFSFDQIRDAMAYETAPGMKAILLAHPGSVS